jgi:glycine/D-amino acid oxidase-like deaminating enzyme
MIPKRAKVVVIGGGVLGTSAAFHLADAGQKDVLLLDRGPIASGTTPFAAGQTGYLKSDPTALEFGVYCVEFFEQFEKRTGHAVDLHQHGSLLIALTEKYRAVLESRVPAAQSVGHEVELISPERARELAPSLQLNQQSTILWIPRDGYVEPKSVAVAFAAAATDRGATIRTRTPVTDVEIVDGRVRAVVTREPGLDNSGNGSAST